MSLVARTPLWPAGRLALPARQSHQSTPTPAPPHKGEGAAEAAAFQRQAGGVARFPSPLWGGAGVGVLQAKHIPRFPYAIALPLVGEMAGRPEGGAKGHNAPGFSIRSGRRAA